MDHNEAVRQKATERYLLDELDPESRDQFEEHLFDCQECVVDLRAAAMFIDQSKIALAEGEASSPTPVRRISPAKSGWLAWLRPSFAVPVFAILLAVIAYQNFFQLPHLETAANRPEVLPYASINVSTRGVVKTEVTTAPEEGFTLLLSIPPDAAYSSYNLELHNPSGGLKWAVKIPASSPDDTRSIHIPGAGLQPGTYNLTVSGITTSGQNSTLGTYPVEVQIQK